METVSSDRVTGVVYDHCLEDHFSLWNKDYTEHPLRTKVCIERCEDLKLLSRCKRIPVRESTLEEIETCHTKEHYELLRSTRTMDENSLQKISQQYDFSYFHQNSFVNASLALGATIDLVEEIVTDKIQNGMAIVRPPGHHAMREEFSGYCYYNNVANAAQRMINKHGLERIIILDWDVHHGQGTQFLFYDDPRVLYVSIHRYEFGEEWPCLRESDYDFIGEGAGTGYNINLPLNEIGCGNDEFLSMFFYVLLPVFQEFDPQLVLVSAGFDSAIGCPEGEMSVTPACFAHFVNLLTPLACGKLALVLEGGYNLKSLAESVALSLRALLGDPTPSISPISTPKLSVIDSVLNAVKHLLPYWKTLCYPDVTDRKAIEEETYPYPNVLQNPPKAGMNFYTDDSRPKMFPLLQECVGDSVMETMEEINRQIDLLISSTCLACPQHKLVIAATAHPHTSQFCNQLRERLKAKKFWKHISQLDHTCEDSSLPLPQSLISKSLDMLTDGTSGACVFVDTCHTDSHNSNGISVHQTLASAIKCAKNSQEVKRILVISIVESESSPVASDSAPEVLHITLSLPGFERRKRVSQSDDDSTAKIQRTNSNITVPFTKLPVTDADVLAAFHLIVLPLSYEFCPDLVLFSWDASTTLSGPVMGMVTQYLHGLAQGRMMMIVNTVASSAKNVTPPHESESFAAESKDREEREVNLVTHCSSVLLGGKCLPVSSNKISDSTIDVIKETLDHLKQQWKSIVYRVQLPKQGS